jgi:hypothetical protein
MLQYVQSHARRVEYERELALESGFEMPPVETSVLTLVFPAEQLQWRRPELPVTASESRGWGRRERSHRARS